MHSVIAYPPQRWSDPDKVYFSHRQLRSHQQMLDAKMTGGGVCAETVVEG